jgi:hypothetical protein
MLSIFVRELSFSVINTFVPIGWIFKF